MDWIGQHGEVSSEQVWRAYVGKSIEATLPDLVGLLGALTQPAQPIPDQIRRFKINQRAVAILAGVTPAAVSKWKGKEGYPQPIPHAGREKLYRLGSVLEFLQHDIRASKEDFPARVAQLPVEVRDALLGLIPKPKDTGMFDVRTRGRDEWHGGSQIRSG